MTKQDIEREITELNVRYSQEKSRLENKLLELTQLEKGMQSHKMKHDIGFYIDIFKHLLQLEKTYCEKGNGEYNCEECKFNNTPYCCIKNWLLTEFDEFIRQAKKEIEDGKIN